MIVEYWSDHAEVKEISVYCVEIVVFLVNGINWL